VCARFCHFVGKTRICLIKTTDSITTIDLINFQLNTFLNIGGFGVREITN